MASAPTDSKLFTRFMTGLCSRIGASRKKDAAIYIVLMIEMLQLLKLEWYLAVKQNNKELTRTAAENYLFHIFTYCGIVRGY